MLVFVLVSLAVYIGEQSCHGAEVHNTSYDELHLSIDAAAIRSVVHHEHDGNTKVVSVDVVVSAPQKFKQSKLLIRQVVGTKSSQVCVEDPPAVADGQGRRVCV